MKKITKLRICDWSLLLLTIIMIASSLQLQFTWLGMTFIWLHIAFGLAFFLLIGWHLQLHFNRRKWIPAISNQKSGVTKLLAVFCALTLITALIATIMMFITWHHSAIGSLHGYLGFAFLILLIIHIAARIRFYAKKI